MSVDWDALRPLVAERQKAEAACSEWDARGEWENVPEDVLTRAREAKRALLAWIDENAEAITEPTCICYPGECELNMCEPACPKCRYVA